MTRRRLVAGNWKMNGTLEKVETFGQELSQAADALDCDMAVCVPFVYVQAMSRALGETPIAVGAQHVCDQRHSGAFTGEVSADMLHDAGATCVVIGHSERRELYGETDEQVVARAEAAVVAGLTPIVCIGESLAQREANETETTLTRQISALFEGCRKSTLEQMVLAYEPIWAIGTGRSATPEQAQSVHAFVRASVADYDAGVAESLPILYGGSVKPDNAPSLFAEADVDGALVGGASLEAESFIGIARAAV